MRTQLAASARARHYPLGYGDRQLQQSTRVQPGSRTEPPADHGLAAEGRSGLRRGALRGVAVIVALSATVALAGGKQPFEYLDEQTGATISVVGQPLVFAHDRSSAPVPETTSRWLQPPWTKAVTSVMC